MQARDLEEDLELMQYAQKLKRSRKDVLYRVSKRQEMQGRDLAYMQGIDLGQEMYPRDVLHNKGSRPFLIREYVQAIDVLHRFYISQMQQSCRQTMQVQDVGKRYRKDTRKIQKRCRAKMQVKDVGKRCRHKIPTSLLYLLDTSKRFSKNHIHKNRAIFRKTIHVNPIIHNLYSSILNKLEHTKYVNHSLQRITVIL